MRVHTLCVAPPRNHKAWFVNEVRVADGDNTSVIGSARGNDGTCCFYNKDVIEGSQRTLIPRTPP